MRRAGEEFSAIALAIRTLRAARNYSEKNRKGIVIEAPRRVIRNVRSERGTIIVASSDPSQLVDLTR